MNDAQKRRKMLLEQTRSRYSEWGAPPAVHPRYRNAYHRLYGEETSRGYSTFGVRTFLCILLFTAFVTMENREIKVFQMNSEQIVQQIQKDARLNLAEIWKNL